MEFEMSERCSTEWVPCDHETLLRHCSDEQIVQMLFFKSTVRTSRFLFRKVIPTNIPDWAKILPQLRKPA